MYLKTNSQYRRDPLEARMLMIIKGYSLKARMLQKGKSLVVRPRKNWPGLAKAGPLYHSGVSQAAQALGSKPAVRDRRCGRPDCTAAPMRFVTQTPKGNKHGF